MRTVQKMAVVIALISIAVMFGFGVYFVSSVVAGRSLIYSIGYTLLMTVMTSIILSNLLIGFEQGEK